ncbi:hypothetical protein GCM10009557_01480 [Virgisporangium ochraceum]|uniref:Uncharacterized protein n=1 Tax=Virgisporangium ochraceum TaxID=65505 RepID=A0A8J4A1R6_9ACTN|nr:hypothetical protein [Virgisporangium ochraceum]GIJ74179.1 hypothetical protein Voc01_090960 [Virgisporangium ochraceum]
MSHRPRSRPAGDAAVPALVRGATPLDSLDVTLHLLCTGPQPLAVDGRTLGHGLPRRMIPLHELAAQLMHPATSFQARDAAWRLLVRRARDDGGRWTVGAVGVALPGLRRAAGRLSRSTSSTDVQLDLLEGFTQALSTVDLEQPRICARLCNAAYVTARRRAAAEEAAASGEAADAPGSRLPPRMYGHPDFVLARAVAAGVITAADAELIGATYLENVPLAEYADRIGISRWAAYRRRDLAKTRLATAIREGRLSDPDAEVITEATLTTVFDGNAPTH